MKPITIVYNGNKDLPLDRNHITKRGYHQLERTFDNIDDAIYFWLECGFYSGVITTLDEILPKGYEEPEILQLLNECPIDVEEVLLSTKELYEIREELEEE